MSERGSQKPRLNPIHSLFFKCTFMVAICVIVVVAVIEFRNNVYVRAKTQQNIAERAEEVTNLLAVQMGGSVKFGNTDAVEGIVSGVVTEARREAVGAVVIDREGKIVFQGETPEFEPLRETAEELARQSLSSGAVVTADNGKLIAMPLRFGRENAVVGSVVTAWSDAYALQALAQENVITLGVALAILVAALGVAAYYLRTRMSQPLGALEAAMERIAGADYDTAVPFIKRRDEIGKMAGKLDAFRMSLSKAHQAQRENAFKSAAFAGSSASLMVVDENANVIFSNPACIAIIESLMPELEEHWPDISSENLVGASLTQLHGMQSAITGILEGGEGAGASGETAVTLRVADRILRIRTNLARDGEGRVIGCVVEWTDRTEIQHNAALLDAINTGQLSVEFSIKGQVLDANDNFLKMINGTKKDTEVCSLFSMFANNLEGDTDGRLFAAEACAGKIPPGRFKAYSIHADKAFVVEGSLAVIKDESGAPEKVIFLGADVTGQDEAMRAAEQSNAKSAEEQGNVVSLLGEALNRLADGDLEAEISEHVPPAYEKLRSDFNGTVDSLRNAISTVIHNSDSIRSETNEITSAADDLSRRTEKQAATLEETAAALDELTVSVRSAAEGADDASKMSADAQKNAEQGGEVARQAVDAMDGIKNSSQEISKITSVIDDIAFQTNLLALNAGVEAARAGEAGRGFAVVATEVRALAQRSSDAAREINTLISSSGEQVRQGVDLVDRTGSALASIVTSVSEISNRVSNIATSAREQSSGLAEINTAVNELDHVTQQNAAMFEETTAASHALTSEADALAQAVARFRLGATHTAPPPIATAPAPASPAKKPVPALPATQGNAALNIAADADGWEEF
ncbi:methyl-accepting chemotaxis protein [Sulfitobacter mediterraneus]|uniref:methyl-accepting chemotaxis protein n=1 Tax=Sulfitobacter mediterraneus TaxID=83219 RepID=UPI0021A6A54E|nr:methyl-accepting chemotaxis protein [Sulfitobacter mediterraneus]